VKRDTSQFVYFLGINTDLAPFEIMRPKRPKVLSFRAFLGHCRIIFSFKKKNIIWQEERCYLEETKSRWGEKSVKKSELDCVGT
jgi:hypothetical protein